VTFILDTAIAVDVYVKIVHSDFAHGFPIISVAVTLANLVATPLRQPQRRLLPEATKGTVFLLALVGCASMMSVEKLLAASWQTAIGWSFISAVFDNIPIAALALKQSGYDWGTLVYTVGLGGSMIWFCSSADMALSDMFSQAKNLGRRLYPGGHFTLADAVGFSLLLPVMGWQPITTRGDPPPPRRPRSSRRWRYRARSITVSQ